MGPESASEWASGKPDIPALLRTAVKDFGVPHSPDLTRSEGAILRVCRL